MHVIHADSSIFVQEGKVAKDIFMRQLRSIVGDEMMRSAIRETRG